MILADEGLNANFIWELRRVGYEIQWIRDIHPGMDDFDIIELAREKGKILITEDNDFGEWIFSHRISGLSIVFLRYDKVDYPIILSYLKSALQSIQESEGNEFITINRNKIRRRKI